MTIHNNNLQQAIKSLQIADHMLYVTYPLINDQKLLLKIFDEINKSIINCITPQETFFHNPSEKYNLSHKDIKTIKEILTIHQKHKQSAMEFTRNQKVIIMSDNLNIESLNNQKIKEYLKTAKILYTKILNPPK